MSKVNAATTFFGSPSSLLDAPPSLLNEKSVSANDIVDERPAQTRSKVAGCIQSVSNAEVGGDVFQNCITIVQNVSEVERKEIKDIESSLGSISRDVTKIDNENKISRQEISNNRNQLISLKQRYLANKARISELNDFIHVVKLKTSQDINSIKGKIYDLENYNLETEREIDSIGIRIDQQGILISIMEDKIELLEDDVGFLMDEYNDGNLKSISFYGAKIDVSNIEGENQSSVGLEYERLLDPKYNMSMFAGISKHDGVVKNEYETLSGIDSQIEEKDIEFYTGDIGVRKFVGKFGDYQPYATASVGKSFGDIDSVSAKVGGGVELYKKYHKISAEVGYSHFFDYPNKNVSFNPAGSSDVDDGAVGAGGPYVSIKYSTR